MCGFVLMKTFKSLNYVSIASPAYSNASVIKFLGYYNTVSIPVSL